MTKDKQALKAKLKRAGWTWESRMRRWEYKVGGALIAATKSLRSALRLDKLVRETAKTKAVPWEELMTRTSNSLQRAGFESPWQAYLAGKETLIGTVDGFGKKGWEELEALFEA